MIEVAERFEDYQMVLAGAPSIEDSYYEKFLKSTPVKMVRNKTYPLLSHSTAALVTSGTATLETALFEVPQVVCYETPLPHLVRLAFKHVMSCKYISLVNLIATRKWCRRCLPTVFRWMPSPTSFIRFCQARRAGSVCFLNIVYSYVRLSIDRCTATYV